MSSWVLLVGSLLLIALAAYAATAIARRRHRTGDLARESAAARRSIRLAETARDAGTVDVRDAERLFTSAQALMSDVPNAATARKAAKMARRAEILWNRQNAAVRERSRTSKPAVGSGRPGRRGAKTARGNPATKAKAGKPGSPSERYAAAIAAQPKLDGADALKIVCVVLLGLIGLIFISNQTQQPDVTFAGQDSRSLDLTAAETDAQLSYDEIVEQYGDAPVVTLPGATAVLDTAMVTEWLQKADARQVILAPPLGPDAENSIEVPDDVVLVIGTYAGYGSFSTSSSDFAGMQQTFAARDVTSSVIALLAHSIDEDDPRTAPEVTWRDPTAEELAPVVAALESDGIAFVGAAEEFSIPEQTKQAYPEGIDPLIVVAPYSTPGQPAVNYADAVAAQFPDRPIVAMTGLWVDFAGPYADDFEAALTASLYGQFGQRLEEHAYPQEAVLQVALGRVEQFRHSGIFDKPLPYQAPDPLELTLPALPWICGALGLVAIAGSLVQIRRQKLDTPTPVSGDALHRLAGLSELAVEVSGLTEGRSKAALLRAMRALTEAKDAGEGTAEGAEVVDELIERAERELSNVAEQLGRPEYRPAAYLSGRWA